MNKTSKILFKYLVIILNLAIFTASLCIIFGVIFSLLDKNFIFLIFHNNRREKIFNIILCIAFLVNSIDSINRENMDRINDFSILPVVVICLINDVATLIDKSIQGLNLIEAILLNPHIALTTPLYLIVTIGQTKKTILEST